MNELIDMFVNNGTAIACLIYFMWYNTTVMKEFTNQMQRMNNNIEKMLLCKDHRE